MYRYLCSGFSQILCFYWKLHAVSLSDALVMEQGVGEKYIPSWKFFLFVWELLKTSIILRSFLLSSSYLFYWQFYHLLLFPLLYEYYQSFHYLETLYLSLISFCQSWKFIVTHKYFHKNIRNAAWVLPVMFQLISDILFYIYPLTFLLL